MERIQVTPVEEVLATIRQNEDISLLTLPDECKLDNPVYGDLDSTGSDPIERTLITAEYRRNDSSFIIQAVHPIGYDRPSQAPEVMADLLSDQKPLFKAIHFFRDGA